MENGRRSEQPNRSEGPRNRSKSKAAPTVSWTSRLIQALLLLMVSAAAWPFGGVNQTRFFWPVVLLSFAAWAALLGRRAAPKPVLPWATIPILVGVLWGTMQLVAWPTARLGVVDPVGVQLWQNADASAQPGAMHGGYGYALGGLVWL